MQSKLRTMMFVGLIALVSAAFVTLTSAHASLRKQQEHHRKDIAAAAENAGRGSLQSLKSESKQPGDHHARLDQSSPPDNSDGLSAGLDDSHARTSS